MKNLTIKYYESRTIEDTIKNYCNEVLRKLNDDNIEYIVFRKKILYRYSILQQI